MKRTLRLLAVFTFSLCQFHCSSSSTVDESNGDSDIINDADTGKDSEANNFVESENDSDTYNNIETTDDDTDSRNDSESDTAEDSEILPDSDEPVICDDGLDCTHNIVDINGSCLSVLISGNCLIDGACYKHNDKNPDNPCEVCLITENREQWTVIQEGDSCGHCLECSSSGQCERMPSCCNLANWNMNSNLCGEFVQEEFWINSGCTASHLTSRTAETYSSSSGSTLGCIDGVLSSRGVGGGSYTHADRGASYSITWNQDNCENSLENIELSCADFCEGYEIPNEVRKGHCSSQTLSGARRNGSIVRIIKCAPGHSECEQVSVECENKQWVNILRTTVEAPTPVENHYLSKWFEDQHGKEIILKEETCNSINCSALDLFDGMFVYGSCTSLSYANLFFEEGDVFSLSQSSCVPPGRSGGTSNYLCEAGGTWAYDGGGGGGGICSSYSWTDTWYKNNESLKESTCTTACLTRDAPNHSYLSNNGFSKAIPPGSSYTRCVFSNGVLASSSIYGCGVISRVPQRWDDLGLDSTCPESVEILNNIAEANSSIEACTSQNCIFWKTDFGNFTRTTSL